MLPWPIAGLSAFSVRETLLQSSQIVASAFAIPLHTSITVSEFGATHKAPPWTNSRNRRTQGIGPVSGGERSDLFRSFLQSFGSFFWIFQFGIQVNHA